MKIYELIECLKKHSSDTWQGKKLEDGSTRDRVLYGDTKQECTGIVSTCYASVDVIKQAGEMGCNLIVVHEALFWNHGDHTDWLLNNKTFQKKKALMDQYHICVWRNHDHIHAGISIKGRYMDGIFYGMCAMLGWEEYREDQTTSFPQMFLVPEMTVSDMAELLMEKFRLKGIRFIGNKDCIIRKVFVPMHLMGQPDDNRITSKINDEEIDCLLTLEMVDFTTCEYIRDAAMAGENHCIFALGHFNMEEIGMEYYAEYLRQHISVNLPVHFIQSGDAYKYIAADEL